MERKSRRLSYILRHHPESIGIKLDEHAYGDVQKILEALNITIEDLDNIADALGVKFNREFILANGDKV